MPKRRHRLWCARLSAPRRQAGGVRRRCARGPGRRRPRRAFVPCGGRSGSSGFRAHHQPRVPRRHDSVFRHRRRRQPDRPAGARHRCQRGSAFQFRRLGGRQCGEGSRRRHRARQRRLASGIRERSRYRGTRLHPFPRRIRLLRARGRPHRRRRSAPLGAVQPRRCREPGEPPADRKRRRSGPGSHHREGRRRESRR